MVKNLAEEDNFSWRESTLVSAAAAAAAATASAALNNTGYLAITK